MAFHLTRISLSLSRSLHLNEALKDEEIKKCLREAVSREQNTARGAFEPLLQPPR